jgi:N-acyl-D-aspartate/D-glutamate deacylase
MDSIRQRFGMHDLVIRGERIVDGSADFILIDFDALALQRPDLAFDLPGGVRRLLRRADGYRATIVREEVVMRDGEPTDARSGRLIRGPQPALSVCARREAARR